MARISITIPGERVVEEFTALVKRPVTPSSAPPAAIGLVEISHKQPTELIPGPVGPQGPRGSRWYTGVGDPTAPGGVLGDMYLDDTSGAVWTWDGTAWVDTGTNIQGSPDTGTEILAKLAPVDGSGSGLDADTLDGQDGAYYLDYDNLTDKPTSFPPTLPIGWTDISGKPATYPPTLPIPSSGVTGLDAYQTAQDAAITAKVGPEAPVDGLTYGRKNATWSTIVGGAVIADTPPPGPLTPGQLWYESDSGNTYLWYDDGDSQQWVQQNIQPGTPPMPSGATALSRNRIVNGAMQISQENGNTGGTTANYYAADQWSLSFAGFVLAGARVVNADVSSGYAFSTAITTGKAPAAGDLWTVTQAIEGTRIADLKWGTASAKQAILTFKARSNAPGTYSISIWNNAADRTFLAPFTLTTADVFETKTIVIPGDATGTWLTTTGLGMRFSFGLAAGTTYQGTAGWQAGLKVQVAGNTNLAATTNNYLQFGDVGLYLDPQNTGVAPPWQMPDEAEELRACQRYWQKLVAVVDTPALYQSWAFPAQFRIAPAVTGGGAGFGVNSANTSMATFYQTARAMPILSLNARM